MDGQATLSAPVTQCDPTSVPSRFDWPAPTSGSVSCPAKQMAPHQRQALSIEAIAGVETISELAREHQVSRKFVYQQIETAEQALEHAFAPAPPQNEVLFHLPVTKSWIEQLVLSLVLTCHSSYRGVVELLGDVFDYPIALGTVSNIVHSAVSQAQRMNLQYDLSDIVVGAHDEIFQAGKPVLVGVDTRTTFCYLLSLEDQRDADTWGVRLFELVDRGFAPEATVADFATGLRAGHEEALPGVPCRGDVFHAFQSIEPVVGYLENRAYEAIATRMKLQKKQATAERRHGRKSPALSKQLHDARLAEAKAIELADDMELLTRWLREDILSLAGPEYPVRQQLFDFVVAELRVREQACPHRIGTVRKLLENQRDKLLAFAAKLDDDLTALAQDWQISSTTVRELLHLQALPMFDPRRWRRETALRELLRGHYYGVYAEVQELSQRVVRASSLVENLNSRLRNYFFLWRQLGEDSLTLLQFFLNHRRYMRSEHPDRVGRSPAELLTGQPHPHWLYLLGYERFSRN
jgi:hypothetical protein